MADTFELIIIGGGPGGLAAAVYGGRARLKTIVINKGSIGGLVNTKKFYYSSTMPLIVRAWNSSPYWKQ
jgi:thioredoxin reductase